MMTPADLAHRLLQLDVMAKAGELDAKEAHLLKRAARLAYAEEAPLRKAARRKVATEKDAGRLQPEYRCSMCGTSTTIVAHHRDYSTPLQVEWFCLSCHRDADKIIAGQS